MARPAPDGGALFFGIVLLALAGALGMWLAIGNDDPQRARQLALDATEALPFSRALTGSRRPAGPFGWASGSSPCNSAPTAATCRRIPSASLRRRSLSAERSGDW